VLNAKILGNDPDKIKEATVAAEKPMAVVFPYLTSKDVDLKSAIEKTKSIIQQSGLWFSDE
jgi:hypothetical protein